MKRTPKPISFGYVVRRIKHKGKIINKVVLDSGEEYTIHRYGKFWKPQGRNMKYYNTLRDAIMSLILNQ